MLSGSRCWPMLSVASSRCRPVPSDDIRVVIPLLNKEGPGVVGRRGQGAGHHPLPPPPARRGLVAHCAARRLQVSETLRGKGAHEKYKNRGNELNNSFKTANLRFLVLKTNSKRTQFKRKKRVSASHFSALCDELTPDFHDVGHQPLDHFVPTGLVLRGEFPAVTLHPFRPRVFENYP